MQGRSEPVDLIIRNGLVCDGTGAPPFEGGVAVAGGRIVTVGDVGGLSAREEIDAQGDLITPGFVDVHTHFDGQAIWSSQLAPSSQHGVTTVVMGNCGVGFAPCRASDHEALISVMEGVEDIPEVAMTEGLTWEWETFPEYLDALDRRPHDIDVAAYLPHSALRLYVMGDRAVRREAATPDDLARMAALTKEAIAAGAIGFATGNIPEHRTPAGDFIPTYGVAETELQAIAGAVRETGRGVMQILVAINTGDVEGKIGLLSRISKTSQRTVTFSFAQGEYEPDQWYRVEKMLKAENARPDVTIKAQVLSRPVGLLLGHDLSLNPFRLSPSYLPIAHLPLAEKVAELRKPEMRERLLREEPADPTQPIWVAGRDFEHMFVFEEPACYDPTFAKSIANLARAKGVSPLELAYDLLLEDEGRNLLFAFNRNYVYGNLDQLLDTLKSDEVVLGLGDAGAHYGIICDGSYPTQMLSYWTRDRKGEQLPLERAVKMLSRDTAELVGLNDRGLLKPGYKADINVIDHAGLTLHRPDVVYDLPAGGRRLRQLADGYRYTVVSGEVISRDGVATGNLPGRLVRGQQEAPAAQLQPA